MRDGAKAGETGRRESEQADILAIIAGEEVSA